MSLNCNTIISFISKDVKPLKQLYDYLEEISTGETYLQYYHPEDYFGRETQVDTLCPDYELSDDEVDYMSLAFVVCGPEWKCSDEGDNFSVLLTSRIDPPIVYFKELCDLFFKDSKIGVEMRYLSENTSAYTFFTNISSYKNCFAIEYFHSKDEETDELRTIENLAYEFAGKFVTQDELIDRLSPFYPEIKTDFNGVLKKLEQKYIKNGLRFIEVDYCPYGEF